MHTFEQRNALLHYRRAFAEMPIGDPMSGAAYGEYLKSKAVGMIIGVVAAVAAVYTGGATLGLWGAAAGGSVSVGSALAGGAMIAGGVMSGVGAITGNTKLTKIGGVLSLAGGLGAMYFGGPTVAGAGAGEASKVGASTVPTDGGTTATTATTVTDSAGATERLMANMGSDKAALDVGTINGVDPVTQAPAAAAPATQASPVVYGGDTVADRGASYVNSSAPATSSSRGILSQVGDALGSTSEWVTKHKGTVEIAGRALLGSDKLAGAEGGENLQNAKAALYSAQATTQSSVQDNNQAQTDALKAKTEAEAQQRKNANTVIVQLDPINDPNYAAKKAEAQAKGYLVQDFTGPAAKGPVVAGATNWLKTSQAPNVTLPTQQARA